jgi:hypothetical protein
MLMGDVGKAIVTGFDLSVVTADMSNFVGRVQAEWIPSITDAFGRLNGIVQPWKNSIGSMIESMMDFVVNMDLYHAYIVTSWGNSINNMWQRVSTFFENTVTMGGWFVGNIGNFFSNMYNNAGRIFGNMVEMMKNYWSALWEFFKTGEFSIDFSPIVDNFNAAMEGIKLPELKTAELNALQSDLDRISQQLADRQAARDKAAQARQAKIGEEKVAQLKIAENVGAEEAVVNKDAAKENNKALLAKMDLEDNEKAITKETQKQTEEKRKQASFSGLAELANKMQQDLFGQNRSARNQIGGAAGQVAAMANGDNVMPQLTRSQLIAMQRSERLQSNLLEQFKTLSAKLGGNQGGIALPDSVLKFGG